MDKGDILLFPRPSRLIKDRLREKVECPLFPQTIDFRNQERLSHAAINQAERSTDAGHRVSHHDVRVRRHKGGRRRQTRRSGDHAPASRHASLSRREQRPDRVCVRQRPLGGAARWRNGRAAGQPRRRRAASQVQRRRPNDRLRRPTTTATRTCTRFPSKGACPRASPIIRPPRRCAIGRQTENFSSPPTVWPASRGRPSFSPCRQRADCRKRFPFPTARMRRSAPTAVGWPTRRTRSITAPGSATAEAWPPTFGCLT